MGCGLPSPRRFTFFLVPLRSLLFLVAGALAALLACPAHAQQAGDTVSVACLAPKLPNHCVDFDATRSVDAGAGPQTYIWHMGDGTTLTGFKISHCYKELQDYTVTLDVQFANTGELRRAERTYPVKLANQELLNFTISATKVHIGDPVVFEVTEASLPACDNMRLTWDFRDGLQAGGHRATHSFRKTGVFPVRLSLRAYGPAPCTDSHCVSREVVVVP